MKITFLAAALIALSVGTTRAEDAVLVSSTVKDFVPGSIITDGQRVNLPQGETAVLLFRSGVIVRLKGPFDAALAASTAGNDTNSVAMLVKRLKAAGTDASVIGASRSVSLARNAMQGQRVMVDPQRSAIYCVGPSDSVWLLRKTSDDLLRLRRGRSIREMKWTSSDLEWPNDLLIEDGDRFETLNPSGEPIATMIFRRLGPEPSEIAWVADSMLRGCSAQAKPALQELAASLAQQG